jgi:ABC-2 type transport system ATP-binding protein
MPEHDCLPTDQSASDIVSSFAELSGIPRREARRRASEVLDLVGVDEARFRAIEGFSTGMRQRVKIAQAIVSHPDLVLLDEPTAGLDPVGRIEMLDLIRRLSGFGISVLLSTHLLEDVERTCSYVVMLSAGRMVVQGSTAQLLAGTGTTVIDIGPNAGAAIPELAARGLMVRQLTSEQIEINASPEQVSATVCAVLSEQNLPLVRLSSAHQSLDQIFVRQAALPQGPAPS